MLNNYQNIQKILEDKKISNKQLCFFAFIKKGDEILMGLREYEKGKPVWTYPGGRSEVNETVKDTIVREIKEETGISNISLLKVVGQKDGVKKGDAVYFVECEISDTPKLMEPDKFKDWKWFNVRELPENLIDEKDREIIKKLYT